MDDRPPAPPEDELRETLDMLGTVVASMSDRLDDQSALLDRVHKTATEARQAAFAARSQTAPEAYGQIVAETLRHHLDDALVTMERSTNQLNRQTDRTLKVLDQAERADRAAAAALRDRERKVETFWHRLPWLGLGAAVLVLALTLLLPRFMAINPTGCAVLGGVWGNTTTGFDVCGFYRP